jgi:hypothetical protein
MTSIVGKTSRILRIFWLRLQHRREPLKARRFSYAFANVPIKQRNIGLALIELGYSGSEVSLARMNKDEFGAVLQNAVNADIARYKKGEEVLVEKIIGWQR